jgi:hypothetical protein
MSLKYQITLPENLAFQMREVVRLRNMPLAQFIRETMEEKLARLRNEPGPDPFAQIRGLVDTGETDWSTQVDEVIANSTFSK